MESSGVPGPLAELESKAVCLVVGLHVPLTRREFPCPCQGLRRAQTRVFYMPVPYVGLRPATVDCAMGGGHGPREAPPWVPAASVQSGV